MVSKLKITPGQVAQYQRDGAILIKDALTAEELQLLERGLEEAYNEPSETYTRDRSPTGEGETMIEQFPSLRCASLQNLIKIGNVPQLAARLMGVTSAQQILDQCFYKKAGFVNATPWHQDTPFLRVRGDDMARVWLSCDPSPRDLTVQVVRGSHKWGIVFNTLPAQTNVLKTAEKGGKFTYDGMRDDSLPSMPDVAKYRDSFDILSWDVEPGDALVFNGNMLHGAEGRPMHGSPRRAFASMWGGPDLRYHVPPAAAMPSYAEFGGHNVPDGARIGDYMDVFPVGWREEPAG
jgi:ectoine hydroxylase-related dioxygenase (phytanoyl-CoA dioxygenase family)